MTTAARPTFDPAKGGSGVREKSLGKLSQQVSARDLPAHLTLKERVAGQDTVDELNVRDLKTELEEREKIAAIEKARGDKYKYIPSLEHTTQIRLALKHERNKEREAEKDALLESESLDLTSNGLQILDARKLAQLDADEDFGSINSDSDFDDDDDDDDNDDDDDGGGDDEVDSDEDDPAELMAELEKIKQERAMEERRREEEKDMKKEEQYKTMSESSFSIKRRWDDDVPFKGCAREDEDPRKKMYINDTLRQEFHRKFMDKYIG